MTGTVHRGGAEAPDGLIFDLDGTLWDATEATAAGWRAGLRALGHRPVCLTAADVAGVCGLPFALCLERLVPGVPAEARPRYLAALAHHEREAVAARGGALYPGVAEGLAALGRRYPLFLVSNCDSWYLELFLAHHGVAPAFAAWACYAAPEPSKAANIAAIAATHGLKRPWYIGDTAADQRAATAAGAAFVHAAYGFGRPEIPCPAVDSFAALVAHLLEDRPTLRAVAVRPTDGRLPPDSH